MTKKYIADPPAGSAGWRRVWLEKLSYPEGSSAKSRLLAPLKRFLEKLLQDDRQRDFNLAMLDLADDRERELATLRDDFVRTADGLARDIRRLEELLRIAVERNDALLVAVDQKVESTAARVRDMTLPLLELPPEERARLRDDVLYRRIEDGLRGSVEQVRESLVPYVGYARRSAPVIDAGCGRGEFLRLCRDAGIEASGFDTNERSVQSAKADGLNVELGAVPSCFATMQDASIGMIFASHVVEHLDPSTLFAFFAEAKRVLKSGGFLALETPNAASIVTSSTDFWRDPTHVAPRHEASLVLLGRELALDVEEIGTIHPHDEGRKLPLPSDESMRPVVERLNEMLFGNQDLRIVFRKS